MTTRRNKLYLLILLSCFAGYVWLYFSLQNELIAQKSVEVCFIKHITHVPCPSCGSTRSIMSLIRGEFMGALNMNPLGYLVALIMLIAPIWIMLDGVMKSNTLYNFYLKAEFHLKKPKFFIPLILLVIINWIWNINKAL